MSRAAPPGIQPLDADHELGEFDCGEAPLNRWLQKHALDNQKNDSSKTRVACDDNRAVIGYYSLAAGSVERDDAPRRIGQGLAAHPVPVAILTRLAVDSRFQNRGLGKALLVDALKTVAEVSDKVGIRALLIHAKTNQARAWYMRQAEFESLPVMSSKLFLLIKDLRKAAGKS